MINIRINNSINIFIHKYLYLNIIIYIQSKAKINLIQ